MYGHWCHFSKCRCIWQPDVVSLHHIHLHRNSEITDFTDLLFWQHTGMQFTRQLLSLSRQQHEPSLVVVWLPSFPKAAIFIFWLINTVQHTLPKSAQQHHSASKVCHKKQLVSTCCPKQVMHDLSTSFPDVGSWWGGGTNSGGRQGRKSKKLYTYLDVTGQQGVFHTRQMP